jgi:hypothetical protein
VRQQRGYSIKRIWIDGDELKFATAGLNVERDVPAEGAEGRISWDVVALSESAPDAPEELVSLAPEDVCRVRIETDVGRTFAGEAIRAVHDGRLCTLTGRGQLAGFDASKDFD